MIPPRGTALPGVPDIPPPNLTPTTTPGVSPTATNRLLTAHGASRPLPVIYGRQNIGGLFVWGTSLSGNLVLVFFLSEGPISRVASLSFNGLDYSELGVSVTYYLGTSSQGIDPTVAGQLATWTSGLPGTAYAVVIVPAPTSASPSFDPLSPQFVVEGRKVRDPRIDPTLVNRYYSVNPALCTADFMTSKRFGIGVDDADVDWSGTLTDAANDCEAGLGRPTAPSGALAGAQGVGPGNLAGGAYYYTYTYTDASGTESLESPGVSISMGSSGASAALNTITTGPAGTTARSVYRSKVSGGQFAPRRLVGVIANNTATTYIDVISDANLGAGPPGSNDRYTMNITLSQQADGTAVLQNLRANWNGFIVFNNGLYQFFVDKAKANSGLTFTNDPADPARNMIGPATYHLKLTEEVPTRVEGTFANAAKNWADDLAIAELPGVTSGLYPRIIKQIEIRGTDGFDQGNRVVTQQLNNGQNDKQVTWQSNFEGLRAQIMDRVTVNDVLSGLSADYLVLGIQPQDNGSFIFQGQIYSAGTYSDVIQTNAPSAAPPYLNPFAAPENVPTASLLDVLPGVFPFIGYIYFQAARIYTLQLWGASSWSQSGLASFVASRVNDGITNVKAFDAAAAADAWLQYDAGSGNVRTFGKVQIIFTGTPTFNLIWTVEYSDNGSTWTAATSSVIAGAQLTSTYTLEWQDAGAHRYWRIRKGSSIAETAANYSDIQFFDAQPDPLIDHYEVWDDSGATPRYYTSIPAGTLPTATNPWNISPLVTIDIQSGGEGYLILLKSVRKNLKMSSGVVFGRAISPSGTGKFILNQTSLQANSNFSIDGIGQATSTLTSGNLRGFVSQQSNAGADEALITLRKSRGTPASPAAILNSDLAGNLSYQVYDGSAWLRQAGIQSKATAAPSGGFATGILQFLTANGANPQEWMRLDNLGQLILFGSSSGYAGFKSPAVGPSIVWTLPTADGSNTWVLSTDGAGHLSFVAPGGGGSGVTSLNSLTGALSIAGATGIGITPSGSTITIGNDTTKADKATGLTASEGVQRVSGSDFSAAAAFKLNIDGLTLKSPAASADELAIWDVAGAIHKKMTIAGIPAAGGGIKSSSGPFASRPSPSIVGQLYFATDARILSRDTGAAWETYGPIFPFTAPTDPGTWLNQGSATIDTTNGGLCLECPATVTRTMRAREATYGSGSVNKWVTAFVMPQLFVGNTSADNFVGIHFRQNQGANSGRTIQFGLYKNASDQFSIVLQENSANGATFGSTVFAYPANTSAATTTGVWLRMRDDGTNIVAQSTNDPTRSTNWFTHLSQGRTAWITAPPDVYGIFGAGVNSNGTLISVMFPSLALA